jgi:trimeric autotransporter adhesin
MYYQQTNMMAALRKRFLPVITGMLSLFFILAAPQLHAQTTVVINTGTAGTPQYNAGPVYRSAASSAYDASRYVYLYTQAELAAVGIFPNSIITQLGWTKNNNATSTGGGIFRIYMKNSSAAAFSAASETWANLNSGTTMVFENLNQTIPATQAPNYITFNLNTPFVYTGGSLEISTEWDINQVAGDGSTGTFDWLWSTVVDRIYGTGNTTLAPITSLSSTTNSISAIDDRRPFIQITFTPGTACAGSPNGGTATSSASITCPNEPFVLSVTGATTASGLSYQWQRSANNSTWTDIPSATSFTYNATQTSSNYYRVRITCSDGSAAAFSTSVLVTTPASPSGVFTINSAVATGGTNFQSFNDAYNFIKCGISGAVTFNVAPGSGPYNEQLIMNAVPGASEIRTITFNGNGAAINFLSTNTDQRGIIKLDGADHVTFDSLVVNALGSTTTEYGFGFHLLNSADSNTIRKCVININGLTTSTNYAGIVISGSATSATTTGTSPSDGNTFDNNTINGGYYGITLTPPPVLSRTTRSQVIPFPIFTCTAYILPAPFPRW